MVFCDRANAVKTAKAYRRFLCRRRQKAAFAAFTARRPRRGKKNPQGFFSRTGDTETAAAAISVVYLWLSVGIFRKFSGRKLTAAGIVFLAAVPFLFVMNGALSFLISEPMLDGWDVLTVFLLLIAAFTFFACDYARHKSFK